MRRLIALYLLCLMLTVPLDAQDNTLTPYEIALQRIEEARLHGTTGFDLCCLKLKELPPEIGQLTNLRNLALYHNELTTLPPEIGQLTNLVDLSLFDNQLTMLPSEIGQLTNLLGIDLNTNQLTDLPPEIGLLNQLGRLHVNGNQLEELPPEIGLLTNLQTLTLHNNHLRELPPEMAGDESLGMDVTVPLARTLLIMTIIHQKVFRVESTSP